MHTDKFVIFHIEGGLGKNVASTAILKNIKSKYPDRKLVVVASFPEIFLNNPHIYRVYRAGVHPYFWDTYVKDKDTVILKREPYSETNHILKKTPLIQTWHDMFDLPFSKETDLPELHMNMIQSFYAQQWRREKPVLLLHTHGGPIMEGQPVYAWTRDMSPLIIQAIVEQFSNQYHIIQVCKDPQQAIQSPNIEVIHRQMSNFELFSLLQVSAKRVLIDSSLQHAAAAFRLPSVVLWVGTSPQVFGYEMHKNIVANQPSGDVKLPDSSYFDFQLGGISHECPYKSLDEMFDTTSVINEIIRF
jgi:hypothetical protein